MINIQLPDALAAVFEGEARYRVAYGGRGSAKSWAFARMALIRTYEQQRRILCARELQNSIKDSVIKLLSDQIHELGLPGFDVGESYIRHLNGSEFIFKGIRTNASEIKSMEGIDICWVEEAQKVSKDSWDIVIPTIRAEGSEIWVTFNPGLKTDPTSQRFIEHQQPDYKSVKINYNDNPWFPAELRREMEYLKRIDVADYRHIWEGEYKDPHHGGRVCPGWTDANTDDIPYNPARRIFLSCDFNVDPLCWALAHRWNGEYFFFDEICLENSNIVAGIQKLAEVYQYHSAGITITGDASGRGRNVQAQEVNYTSYKVMLKEMSDWGFTNFQLDTPQSNPLILKRIEAFNAMVCNPDGKRRVKADRTKCKQIIHTMDNLRFIPGSSQIWLPTPKQIEQDPKMKFLRDDMFDAVSYLVYRYDPADAPTKEDKAKSKLVTREFRPR